MDYRVSLFLQRAPEETRFKGNYTILRFKLSIFILYMVMDKINTDKKIQSSQISYFKLMDKFPT